MKIKQFTPPRKGEVPGVPPNSQWIDGLLKHRDQQLEDLTTAASGRLSVPDNMNSDVRVLSLFHDTDVEILTTQLKGKPLGVLLLDSALYDYAQLKWEAIEGGVKIAVKWDSAPTEPVDVRIAILGF